MTSKPFLRLAQASYFALLMWVVLWHSYLSPHVEVGAFGVALFWTVPLLLPIPGILKQKAYTFAWANFILLLYFLHSLTMVYVDEGERWLAVVELALTTLAFTFCTLYSRLRGKELGLKIKKLSELKQEEDAYFANQRQSK
ncbi:DUF2069 domain-containing protein [Vibrio ulleungensis]|jgi:uncharacterized membrane protein|uniref:DUF2069 domain-containing protein n=1 Tax=Vibrio ulleungensis TaxID=2807619 RepID=A0ABS2HK73_9VIBR|nr:DUF2069 domain-containing protein [Vibrio ulleungensis]MBM7036464.1 DUF2069 domain-containing protein [Vibrio ulleungensis]